MLFITSQLLLTLLWIHQSIAADTCSVIGLPDDTQRRGNVYFLRYNVPSVELSLQCRCTVSTPSWVQYKLQNDTFTNALPRSVECVKNGTECSPKRYIILPSQVEPGFYLYQNYTFRINEPTVLLCSSTNEKLTVVVNVQVNNHQDHSTATATTGNLSATEQLQPCLSTTSTVHNTAADGTSTTVTSSLTHSTTTNLIPSVTKAVEQLTTTASTTTTVAVYPSTSTTTSTSTTSASAATTGYTTSTSVTVEVAVSSTDVSMSSHYSSTSAEVTPIIVIGKNTEMTDCSLQAFGTPAIIFLSLMCLLVIVNVVLVLYIVYIKKTHIKVAKEFNYLANNISRRGSTIDSRERSESVDNELSPTHSNSEV